MGESFGNIMITRLEDDDTPADNHYRILNLCDEDPNCDTDSEPDRKRIEPEIHYLQNDRPVVYYSLQDPDNLECTDPVYSLMRAKVGPLWQE